MNVETIVQSLVTVAVAAMTTFGVMYKSRTDAGLKRRESSLDEIIAVVNEYKGLNDVYKSRWEEADRRISTLQKELENMRNQFEIEIAKRDEYIARLTAWGHAVVEIVSKHGISIPEIPSDVDL